MRGDVNKVADIDLHVLPGLEEHAETPTRHGLHDHARLPVQVHRIHQATKDDVR